MTATAHLVVALTTASAFSSLPSAYYHRVAEATGSSWTTVVLFVAHGLASVLAMTAVGRPSFAERAGRLALARVVPALLVADAAGSVLLVLAPAPAGVGWLLAGRIVTGAALGALTLLVTAALGSRRQGSVLATAAILGGVGAGSLIAGVLAQAGLGRAAVFGAGTLALLLAAAVARGLDGTVSWQAAADVRGAAGPDARIPAVGAPTAIPAPRTTVLVLACAALAFAANGVLGLFTSTLPGVVAAQGGGTELLAGTTAGLVMLAAGGARLALLRAPVTPVRVGASVAAVVGALLFARGVDVGSVAVTLLGGVLLGAAAGVGYDAALHMVAGRGAGVGPLARVQRGGQLGLVVPVVLYPLVVR